MEDSFICSSNFCLYQHFWSSIYVPTALNARIYSFLLIPTFLVFDLRAHGTQCTNLFFSAYTNIFGLRYAGPRHSMHDFIFKVLSRNEY